MKKRAKTPTTKQRLAKADLAPGQKLPLIEHLHELKRRLFYVAACVAVGAAVAYGLERRLIDVLLRPSHGQDFIYTSPMGGMNFLFSVCLDIGLVLATPVIIYQLLAFVQPLMRGTSRRFLLFASASTGVVAVLGVLFGFFVGLPQALHFLLHQFVTVQVKPLITIQSYVQFVALYLLGSALMFQLPLILLFINRIKPLKPQKLFKYERHLIVAAFIIAFIMNPTPNVVDQLLVVIPIVVTYQFSIALLWFVNHGKLSPDKLAELRKQDALRQAERTGKSLQPLPDESPLPPDTVTTELPVAATDSFAAAESVIIGTAATEPVEQTPPALPAASTPQRQYNRAVVSTTRRSYLPLRGSIIQ
jgi:sec-independent protein translocase protein TatC